MQNRREEEARVKEEQRKTEEALRKEAEERKQREAAEKKKQQEEAKKEEQRALATLRKAFQRVLQSDPDAFSSAKKDLLDELEKESKALGAQLPKIREEIEKILKTAEARVEKVREAKRKQEEQKQAAEERREQLEKALSELSDLVDEAEARTDLLRESIQPLMREDVALDDIPPMTATVNEHAEEAQTAHGACQNFISSKNLRNLGQLHVSLAPLRVELMRLIGRVNESASNAQHLLHDAKVARTKVVKRLAARKKLAEDDALFKLYDSTGDGHWSKEELAVFAKAELQFELSDNLVDRYFEQLVPEGEPGIPRNKLQQFIAIIGIARDNVISRRLSEERSVREAEEAERQAEKKKVVDQATAAFQEQLREAVGGDSSLEVLEREVVQVEERVRPMFGKGASSMPLQELVSRVKELSKMCLSWGERLQQLRERIDDVSTTDCVPEIAELKQMEVKKLTMRADRVKARHTRIVVAVENGRMVSMQRSSQEVEKQHAAITGFLRSHMNDKQLGIDGVFAAIDTKGDKALDEEEFVGFMERSSPSELGSAKFGEFFLHCCNAMGKDARITLEDFIQLLKTHNKVIEQTAMTTVLNIRESKNIRRLQVGEVIEVLEGPRLEDSARVMRVRGRAVSDGAEGWITVAGNQGTRYLEQGGNVFKVMLETDLEPALSSDIVALCPNLPKVVRRLKMHEVVEILQWERKEKEEKKEEKEEKKKDDKKDASRNITLRVRCRAKEDGATGWAMTTDANGVARFDMV